ncbi:MAG: hypothetical protein RMM17_09940 [Acidobacteriota bacterium]|nr:hypothetical protein [Blastocatellia bacterium]MDW8412989.1 hypothetical protein [Acidobacteriota bacterium]
MAFALYSWAADSDSALARQNLQALAPKLSAEQHEAANRLRARWKPSEANSTMPADIDKYLEVALRSYASVS